MAGDRAALGIDYNIFLMTWMREDGTSGGPARWRARVNAGSARWRTRKACQ
jgi:hypothetical protein